MTKISTATFKGQSGQKYDFNVYPMDQTFKSLGAVYAVTRRYQNSKSNSGYSHEIIYVGETSDLSTRFDNHHKWDCFVRHNANCICTHVEADEDIRLTIEDDLVKQHSPDCND